MELCSLCICVYYVIAMFQIRIAYMAGIHGDWNERSKNRDALKDPLHVVKQTVCREDSHRLKVERRTSADGTIFG